MHQKKAGAVFAEKTASTGGSHGAPASIRNAGPYGATGPAFRKRATVCRKLATEIGLAI
ncbi:hypothetical protein ROR02_14830 [Pararhodospirillum oryzae]|uniref:Uncharacterized protein n=1 Tax=Pararhodospirillum oryzae TaxID=478448 RepID=A0A512H7C3_9PROT|nr:hypothetical protein ROR02_14830 [Pararhodospirillum oryzae]